MKFEFQANNELFLVYYVPGNILETVVQKKHSTDDLKFKFHWAAYMLPDNPSWGPSHPTLELRGVEGTVIREMKFWVCLTENRWVDAWEGGTHTLTCVLAKHLIFF